MLLCIALLCSSLEEQYNLFSPFFSLEKGKGHAGALNRTIQSTTASRATVAATAPSESCGSSLCAKPWPQP